MPSEQARVPELGLSLWRDRPVRETILERRRRVLDW
jgi:hypothetical protein